MKNSQSTRAAADRRSFLKLAGAGLATGGAVLAGAAQPAAAAEAQKENDGLYHETEHIKRYYEIAKSM